MTEGSVRLAQPSEAESISELAQATFAEAFADALSEADLLIYNSAFKKKNTVAEWFKNARSKVWVAEMNSLLVGYLALTPPDLPLDDPQDGDLEIRKIYLLKRFHGSGLAKKLLDLAVAHAKSVGCKRLLLGVNAGNQKALKFYFKSGFVRIGTRKFQVGDSLEDDLILALPLSW